MNWPLIVALVFTCLALGPLIVAGIGLWLHVWAIEESIREREGME